MQGTVPYLGTFLTDLTMLDTALQDYIEVGSLQLVHPGLQPSSWLHGKVCFSQDLFRAHNTHG